MSNNIRNQPMYVASGSLETENMLGTADLYPGTLGSKVTVNVATGATGAGATAGAQGKTYQRIQVDSTVTTAPFRGAVAWWSNKATALVTTSPTNRGRVAGVFRNAITPGNIGFIQTGGPCATVKIIDTPTAAPTAAGLIVIPSATAGKADVLAAGSAATYPPLGQSTSAVIGGTSECSVDLDVPETN